MTVRTTSAGTVALEGLCPSEDADALLKQLLATPGAAVDWRACDGAHTAVVQVLMAARPALIGPPLNSLLLRWVEPILTDTARKADDDVQPPRPASDTSVQGETS